MILSRTSQYAVQALIYMATQPDATPVLNKDIAAKLGVPAPYLAKILQSLAKGNLLFSFRGRLGGFCLREGGQDHPDANPAVDRRACVYAELPVGTEKV